MFVSMFVSLHFCMDMCLFKCMYACMDVCLYVCMYVCWFVCMYAFLDGCIYICMHVCMFVGLHPSKYVYVLYEYICLYVCIEVGGLNSHGQQWAQLPVNRKSSTGMRSHWESFRRKSPCYGCLLSRLHFTPDRLFSYLLSNMFFFDNIIPRGVPFES